MRRNRSASESANTLLILVDGMLPEKSAMELAVEGVQQIV